MYKVESGDCQKTYVMQLNINVEYILVSVILNKIINIRLIVDANQADYFRIEGVL